MSRQMQSAPPIDSPTSHPTSRLEETGRTEYIVLVASDSHLGREHEGRMALQNRARERY